MAVPNSERGRDFIVVARCDAARRGATRRGALWLDTVTVHDLSLQALSDLLVYSGAISASMRLMWGSLQEQRWCLLSRIGVSSFWAGCLQRGIW
jgi:hypothetical protein